MSLIKKSIILLSFYGLFVSSAIAAPITETYTHTYTSPDPFNPQSLSVDGASLTQNITVPIGDFPAGYKITEVKVGFVFDKQNWNDGLCGEANAGGNQRVYNNEIGFAVASPAGTSVTLVEANTGYYSGNTRPEFISVIYDDDGAVFSGTTPTDGIYQPQNPLSAFDNSSSISGDWVVTMTDTADRDPLCVKTIALNITANNEADVSVTKTDGATTYTPGESGSYTITVSNAGPISVEGALINDTLPNGATGVTWTCAGAGGSSCATASGSGNIVNESVDLAVGGTVTFTVDFTWSTNPADY